MFKKFSGRGQHEAIPSTSKDVTWACRHVEINMLLSNNSSKHHGRCQSLQGPWLSRGVTWYSCDCKRFFRTVHFSHPSITYNASWQPVSKKCRPTGCRHTDCTLSSGLICRSFSDWWKHKRHVTSSNGWQSRLGSPQRKLWRRGSGWFFTFLVIARTRSLACLRL